MDLLDQLNIDKTEFDSYKAETPGGSMPEPGVYLVAVEKAYTRTTDSGAVQLEISLKTEDERTIFLSSNMVKKNGENNEIGTRTLKAFKDALKVEKLEGVKATIKIKDKDTEVTGIKGIQGIKFKIGVKLERNDEYGDKLVAYKFMDSEGKNGDGEFIEDEVAKNIKDRPEIKKRGGAANKPAATVTPQSSEDMEASGWS